MVTWIVEENVFNEACFDRMISHFRKNNIPYHTVRIIPFVHEVDGQIPQVSNPVVVYGSIGSQKLAHAQNWFPGVWTGANFSEKAVNANLNQFYLNYDAVIVPISKMLEVSPWDEFFIKPSGDSKEFAGEVMRKDDFDKWYNRMISIGYLENNDFDVAISSVKEIGTEYRVVVVNGKAVTASMYRQYNVTRQARVAAPDFQDKIDLLEQHFIPAPVYVVDLTVSRDGTDWKVIEYNTFNSAGLYECDVASIIDRINDYIEERYEDIYLGCPAIDSEPSELV